MSALSPDSYCVEVSSNTSSVPTVNEYEHT